MPRTSKQETGHKLTAEAFEHLLRSLGSDRGDAGTRYERLRQRLILFFLRRLLSAPEDLADEVIDRLTRRLAAGLEVASPEAFALGIARHVAQEQMANRREIASEDKFLENISAEPATTCEQARERERQLDAMERSLGNLPEEEVQLLTEYYLVEQKSRIEARKHLARKLGLTQAALRKKLYGTCMRLREAIRSQTESQG